MKTIKIDKHTHIEPGKQIKIVLSRCKEVSQKQGFTELSKVYTIIDRPSRNAKRNGDSGVWIEKDGDPIFVWFFEWIPFIPTKIKTINLTKESTFVRTKFSFIRTK